MSKPQNFRAFTLVEMLVSMTVLAILLLMLVQMVNQVTATWKFSTAKAEQFRSARSAFEAMTRRLGQATLNTYWDYVYTKDASGKNTGPPLRYTRQSDLRFLVDSAGKADTKSTTGSTIVPKVKNIEVDNAHPTHCVFFQAPLGYVDDAGNTTADSGNPYSTTPGNVAYRPFTGLDNLLNTWGYFVEYNTDQWYRPTFFQDVAPTALPPERYRYRLMELMQPSNQLGIYKYTTYVGPSSSNLDPVTKFYSGHQWFTDALDQTNYPSPENRPVHVLAENVIALILLPKLSAQEEETNKAAVGTSNGSNQTSIAPSYAYDSAYDTLSPDTNATDYDPSYAGKAETNSFNQLPSIVGVTMVAIDETSAIRLVGGVRPTPNKAPTPPDFGLSDLFKTETPGPAAAKSAYAANYLVDLQTLQTRLNARHLNYRVFTTNVSIRGAKWSRN